MQPHPRGGGSFFIVGGCPRNLWSSFRYEPERFRLVERQAMSNSSAAQVMIGALRALGRVEPVDEALVETVVALALAVDMAPDNASLWREYRSSLVELRNVGGTNEQGNEIEKLIEALRGGPEVRDTAPPKPRNARPRGGKADGAVRNTADAVATDGARRRAGGKP